MKTKYFLLIISCMLFAVAANCQHQFYFENFEAATNTFILNDTAKALRPNTGNNKWIVNKIYTGGGIYPKTNNEDSTYGGTITNHPYSKYLHIYDSASGYVNDNYNPTDSSTRFAHMTTGICTKAMTNINFNFFYICQGSPTAYGKVYYSINGGKWIQTGSPLYNNRYKWQYATITNPAFNNVESLRFGFLWHNNSASGKDTSALGIDDVSIFGAYDSIANPIKCTFTTYGFDSCLGGSDYVYFGATLNDSTCNAVWDVYMSNGNGSGFSGYAWYQSIGPSFFNDITSYWYLIPPATFKTVGSCYKFKLVRTSYPYLTYTDSVCFPFDSCPGTITTLQPPVTLDTTADTIAICAGSVIDVPFFSTGIYATYNTYYAELIDSIGKTAKIDTIGNLPSNVAYPYPPGNIVGTIPLTVPAGCRYYLRVVSTTANRKPSIWGPFCIQHCDIITNNQQSLQACLKSCKKQPQGYSDTISYVVHKFDTLADYDKPNKFEVQLIQFMLYPPSFTIINTGLLGVKVDTVSGKMRLHVPCPDTLFANGINPGVYYIRVVATNSNFPDSAFGSLVHLTIGEPADSMYLTVVPGTGPYCAGSTITFNTNPDHEFPPYNSTYAWTIKDKVYGTRPFAGWTAGYLGYNATADTFLITCQENNYGCLGPKATLKDTVIVLGAPSISKTGPPRLCVGDTGIFSIPFANNTNYKWKIYAKAKTDTSNNVLKIRIDTIGKVRITVVAFNACFTDSAVWIVNVFAKPVAKITGNTTICYGKSLTLTASGGTSYTWSNGSGSATINVTPPKDTLYWVKVSNVACSAMDTVKVTVLPLPVIKVSPTNSLICRGDTVRLTATGGQSYTWLPNIGLNVDTGSVVLAFPTTATIYMVRGKGANGCTDSANATVTIDVPLATISSAASITQGQSITLNATGGGTYQWTPPSGLNSTTDSLVVASPTVTTTYTVIITDKKGCRVIDTVTVEVNPKCGDIFVPDAFSPNGDGFNDVLYARNNCIKQIDFIIYDRWGNKIFESADPKVGWNGNYKGQPMNTGTYVYYVSVLTFDNQVLTKKGNVALVR